jgi:flagellar assembly factor FliW
MIEPIKSRFGEINVDTTKAISFPRGLLGMPDKSSFVLAPFPNDRMQQFTLLQSLEDHMLSFITLPLAVENPIISYTDLHHACQELSINRENLAVLLIVSVHRGTDQAKLSVNARAPLLIDVTRKTGQQYVFQNDSYKVQHMLT